MTTVWHHHILAPATKKALAVCRVLPSLGHFYLAGGTSLALQIGHRESVDLDFFGTDQFDPMQLADEVQKVTPQMTVRSTSESTLHAFICDAQVSFIRFTPPLIKKPLAYEGIRVALIDDLVPMKLSAVCGRGSKKDFVDIATLLELGYTLDQMFSFWDQRFSHLHVDHVAILKSLVYFDDAETEPMPLMHSKLTWEQTKKIVSGAVHQYMR